MTAKTGVVLTAASIAAGVLNYLFQVHAAAVLDPAAFGLLSAWLAEVTLVSSIASLVQYISLDFRIEGFRKSLVRAGAVSALLLLLLVAVGRSAPVLGLGATSVAGAIALHAVIGQLQARLRLGVVATSVLVTATVRFGLPFATTFYVAHAAAALAGVATAAVLVSTRPGEVVEGAAPESPAPARRLRLGRPVLLAFSVVLLPQLDVLVLARLQDPATLGAYSRVALAARIVFFGGAAVLQTVLPHQVHAAERKERLPSFVAHVQRWLGVVLVAGAVALAGMATLVLHPKGEERTWLFGSCVSAALLVALLGHVQRFAAHRRLATAAGCLVGALVASGVAAGISALSTPPDVTRFVLAALAGDAIVLVVAVGLSTMHSRIQRREVASRP